MNKAKETSKKRKDDLIIGVIQRMNYTQSISNITLLEVVRILKENGNLPDNFDELVKENFNKFQEEK